MTAATTKALPYVFAAVGGAALASRALAINKDSAPSSSVEISHLMTLSTSCRSQGEIVML